MSVALKLYERLTEAADDRERFRLIVDAIGTLEAERPHRADFARTTDLHETELRLQKESEQTRLQLHKEIEATRLRLGKESAARPRRCAWKWSACAPKSAPSRPACGMQCTVRHSGSSVPLVPSWA
ncbi:MAG: hypothetical protein PVJ47_08145 [Thiohalocapsa sp.]|jgi:hypothetical protein